ncbi:MAG: right-handed parallel beta-helix repeat-containing protein [Cryobacterium sp.]|nr:right-handed parallel beta-helix repeat-containing protein [Cryobacterium sp.]MBX3089390.1 right-handed parallel beta-helix repeat-containing protein [Cryobacterium sp.]MCC7128695.1 right-handed parallel beta-helix repeat-containing protein [Microbacteriaceae bacterium]
MHANPISRFFAAAATTALVASALILGTALPASAATISVPVDYATIQDAVNAAASGDTVNVAAGTYAENVTVPAGKSLTITGAGAGVSTITGRVTLSAPTTVSGFTVQGQAAATPPYAQDPFWVTSTGAGSIIENNTIQNGQRGVYISGVVGSASVHTIVRNNTILETGFGNTGAVWIASSTYVDVTGNTFTNTTGGGVGINLVGGSSNISITGNSFTNFGNALVLIANSSGFPSTPQSHDIDFSSNTITNNSSTALYIGGNNIKDVTIKSNTITTIVSGSAAAILFTAGYGGNPTAWLEPSNRPLEGFVIEDNDFDDMAYGLIAGDGVQLDSDTAVQIIRNRFCTVHVLAIDNRDTPNSVYALDNTFCGSDVSGLVVVANTPQLADTGSDNAIWYGLAGGFALLSGLLFLVWARRRSALDATR